MPWHAMNVTTSQCTVVNLWKQEQKKKQIREELTWCRLVFLLLYENENKVKKKKNPLIDSNLPY